MNLPNTSKVDLVMATASAAEAQQSSTHAPGDDDSEHRSNETSDPSDEGASSSRWRRIWSHGSAKAVAWIVTVAIATGCMWIVVLKDSESVDSSSSTAPTEPAPAASLERLKALNDPVAGYHLEYPATWAEVASADTPAGPDGHVVRIAGENAMSIRTFALERPVEASAVADMRAVTDAILSSPKAQLTVLDVRETEVAGLPTIYYLYYFPAGSQRGIHAHYFIFDRTKMHALIFQVVPDADFADYAKQFDQVVASFKSAAS
ncbi:MULTISPECIES: PsbP-related protein [unclassified Nocardioides]|uniref:PsbP-related protein n=1 Tax=unclassified Nocardioides TaxID=2615069 RepID=UPI000B0AB9B8|nr:MULTISPECIES: hypothetical protein [unclassified Nocardioides]